MSAAADELLDAVAGLLARRVGLSPATLGRPPLAAAVAARRGAVGKPTAADYLERLRADEEEFRALTEELVVVESWFFRDVQPFECLRWFVEKLPRRPLRLLSVPCGTGEEPYSMALTLLAAGLALDEFTIDAIDLSRRALDRAAESLHGPRSFRESVVWAVPVCRRYLSAEGGAVRVGREVRECVRFREGNLADSGFLAGQRGAYEVIFCRNLLIYFTAEARRTALTHLHRLLAEDGLLYLGHTEGRAALDQRFAPRSPRYPFAFTPARETAAADSAIPTKSPRQRRREGEGEAPAEPGNGANPARREPRPPVAATTARGAGPSLEEARAAADAGRLDAAGELCEALARQRPPAAEVLCLLGVVRQAQGRAGEAQRWFEQALYLDPGCREALVHLALLAEGKGNREQAAHYRRRARRPGKGGKS
jgi:chemotaxis protein methyltransferase WspC